MRKLFTLAASCFIHISFMVAASLPIEIPVANKCIEAYKCGNYKNASSLLQQLSPRDSCSARSPTSGSTLLHYAAGCLRIYDVKKLLDEYDGESEIEWKNKDGNTPLHYATRSYGEITAKKGYSAELYQNFCEIIEILGKKKSGLINLKNSKGETILHLLVRNNVQEDIFLFLKKQGVLFDSYDNKNRTALHDACYTKNSNYIDFLKNNPGIKINFQAVDLKGKKAIEYAFPCSAELLESFIWLRAQESKL